MGSGDGSNGWDMPDGTITGKFVWNNSMNYYVI